MALVIPGSPAAARDDIDLTFRYTRAEWQALAELKMGDDDGPPLLAEQMTLLRGLWQDIDSGLIQHYDLPSDLDGELPTPPA